MIASPLPTATPPAAELVIENVTQRYGDGEDAVSALEEVSFSVPAGKVTSLVGPSGCGKSTLLDIIAGLACPIAGRVRHGDRIVNGPDRSAAMVFQQPALLPWLDVRDNIALGLKARGVRKADAYNRIAPLLELVHLGGFERAYPHQLSGGMAQRVGIARALALEPSVLLMDEPFSAVDAYTRAHLQSELLHIINRHQTTVVFVTHDVSEAVFLGDRVVVLSPRPGRVVQCIELEPAAHDRSTGYHAKTVGAIFELLAGSS